VAVVTTRIKRLQLFLRKKVIDSLM